MHKYSRRLFSSELFKYFRFSCWNSRMFSILNTLFGTPTRCALWKWKIEKRFNLFSRFSYTLNGGFHGFRRVDVVISVVYTVVNVSNFTVGLKFLFRVICQKHILILWLRFNRIWNIYSKKIYYKFKFAFGSTQIMSIINRNGQLLWKLAIRLFIWKGVRTLRSTHTWYIAVLGKSKQTAQHRIPPKRDSSFSLVCDVLGIGVDSVFFRLASGSSFPAELESLLRFALLLLLLADWLIGGGLGFDCDEAVSTWISADIIGMIFELSTFRLTACCWFCINDDIDETDAELLGSTILSAILAKW